jgi:hypothetical protein
MEASPSNISKQIKQIEKKTGKTVTGVTAAVGFKSRASARQLFEEYDRQVRMRPESKSMGLCETMINTAKDQPGRSGAREN